MLKKVLYLSLAMLDDVDSIGYNKSPKVHQAVDSGIHREKVGIDDGNGNFSNVRTCSTAEEC